MIRSNGSALPEILLLMVLMSILASVIVPHVSGVRQESKCSTLASDLGKIRSGIHLYRCQHKGRLPAFKGEGFGDFARRMTKKTNADGDSGMEFGPYLWRLPVNPFNGLVTVRIDGAGAGTNLDGWRFDTRTGAFQADNSPEHATF